MSGALKKSDELVKVYIHTDQAQVDRVGHYRKSCARLKLGRTLTIPTNSILEGGVSRIDLIRPHYELVIGIGNDHTALLIISEDALCALKKIKPEVIIS